jgi:uridine kinase
MKKFLSSAPIRLPMTFADPREGIELVKRNEREVDERLTACAAAISADCVAHGVRVIRLSGPTCVGKTTAAHKLTEALEAAGRVVHPISIDDFYYGRDVLHRMAEESGGTKLDYDSVKTIDLPALRTCVQELMEQGRTQLPIFDFKTGYPAGYRDLTIPEGEEPVFLFEGIQAVYPEVVALFEGIPNRSLFINVMQDTILYDGEGNERVFTPDRIRLLRRLVRDEAKRGTCPDFTLELWHSVRENEVKSILPYADSCDYGIDSNMAFDIHMLAPHVRRIFKEQPCDGPEVAWQAKILSAIEGVEGISDDCLDENSLYHEFIPLKN